ncbi:MAG TPA: glucose 1-dehydrogenase [Polyangia bacterium]|jgi:threonine dehydrogenase-like Zn-dependent dehydrogenase
MKAVAVFPEQKAVRVVTDHPEPRLERDTEVRLKMLDIGVCGTDREIARFDYGTPPPGSPYLVIGHESLGEVLEVGRGVARIKPGDLVVTMVRRPCGHADCPACAINRPDFCITGAFTERGISGRNGFMTEQVVDDESYMIVLPPDLRAVGVLLEPLTIAEKALIEVGDVQDRLPWLQATALPTKLDVAKRAVVLGAGPVGLLGAMALLVRGFDTSVYSLEPADSPKAKWVASVGGHYLSSADVPIAALPTTVGNIDLIYEATGSAKIAFKAIETLGVNGMFIFTGVPGHGGAIELDADLIMRNLVLKNQLIYGTVNAGRDAFEKAAVDLTEFHRRWPTALAALITGRYAPEACESLLLGPSEGIKRVVSFGGAG